LRELDKSSAGDGGSVRHDLHASGTHERTAGLSPQMDPSTQYRSFAEECRRLAEQVESERHRRLLYEMALAWSKLADETERAGLQPST
jgi:hypothetical protein